MIIAETVSISCTPFDDGDRRFLLEWMATLITLCGPRQLQETGMIVVTGATGRTGRRVTEALLAKDEQVRTVRSAGRGALCRER
jgi:hypothetical protein